MSDKLELNIEPLINEYKRLKLLENGFFNYDGGVLQILNLLSDCIYIGANLNYPNQKWFREHDEKIRRVMIFLQDAMLAYYKL